VRGERRPRRGIGSSKLLGPSRRRAGINGLDGKSRTTALHLDPRPTRLCGERRRLSFRTGPAAGYRAVVAVSCNKPIPHQPVPFFRGLLAHRREMRQSTAGATSIETSNNIFNEVLCQVDGRPQYLDDGGRPKAGIPMRASPGIRRRSVATA